MLVGLAGCLFAFFGPGFSAFVALSPCDCFCTFDLDFLKMSSYWVSWGYCFFHFARFFVRVVAEVVFEELLVRVREEQPGFACRGRVGLLAGLEDVLVLGGLLRFLRGARGDRVCFELLADPLLLEGTGSVRKAD